MTGSEPAFESSEALVESLLGRNLIPDGEHRLMRATRKWLKDNHCPQAPHANDRGAYRVPAELQALGPPALTLSSSARNYGGAYPHDRCDLRAGGDSPEVDDLDRPRMTLDGDLVAELDRPRRERHAEIVPG